MAVDGSGAEAVSEQQNWRGYAQIALVVVVMAAAIYFARAPSFGEIGDEVATMATGEPPVVDVVQPVSTEQALTVKLTGTVSPQKQTTITSEVEGRVVWMSPDFTPGGTIAAGDPLLRIDPADFELAVEEAQAAVVAAEARVRLEEALGADNAQTFTSDNPDAEPSPWLLRVPHIALAQAELGQAQAALARAELRLARTHLLLPYDVHVIATNTAVGEWASPDDTSSAASLGIVYQSGDLHVRVPIEPRELAYLEPAVGRSVQVTGRMGGWGGEIVGVSGVVNPTSRLTAVFVEFAADAETLPTPGAFVEIDIEGPAFDDVFVLPNTVRRPDGGIWVVLDGHLHRVDPESRGQTAEGWVVKAFDAGEGVLVGMLPGAREGLEVSARALTDAN